MTRKTKAVVFGFVVVAIVLALGLKDGAKAQVDTHSSLESGTIYPAGGSDGPPSL